MPRQSKQRTDGPGHLEGYFGQIAAGVNISAKELESIRLHPTDQPAAQKMGHNLTRRLSSGRNLPLHTWTAEHQLLIFESYHHIYYTKRYELVEDPL